ncbi:glycosyltransferase family 39 protein [Corynebacterium alimapuense]|nr:glycosyltransferase family 39 protein [Corynebacterium alimapuense]
MALIYFGAGAWVALSMKFFLGDSLGRVQEAQSVLFGRDPSLSAMGFVFTPLSTLAEIPLVAATPLIPEMTRYALAAVVVSALFMAGACYQLWKMAIERGVPLWFSYAVVLLFALNPMIIFYGATGMSEAPFLFAMLWACRRLLRWLETDDVHDLAAAGVALAVAFLARYDALVVSVATAIVVGMITWKRRSHITAGLYKGYALVDVLVFLAPVSLAFLVWTISGWLITGDLVSQLSSSYGNEAIIEQLGGLEGGAEAFSNSLVRILILAPLLPLLLLVSLMLSIRRGSWEMVLPVVLMGSALAFQVFSATTGTTFEFLRFFLVAIGLNAVLLLLCAPASATFRARRPGRAAVLSAKQPAVSPGILGVLVAASAASIALTFPVLGSDDWAPQEYALQQELSGNRGTSLDQIQQQSSELRTFGTERRLADYLDVLNLADGAVLVDSTYGFAVVVASNNPRQFTIPSDSDFIDRLEEPAEQGVEYILAVPSEGRGAQDPINLRYPTFYADGADIATLELIAVNDGRPEQPDWRLYRVRQQ